MKDMFVLRCKVHCGPKEIIFDDATLEVAKETGRKWCKQFGNKFILVRPFYRDLAGEISKDESEKSQGKITTETMKAAVKKVAA